MLLLTLALGLGAMGITHLWHSLPDELASTRQWIASVRQASAAPPSAPAPAGHHASDTGTAVQPAMDVSDPFRLQQQSAPVANPAERPLSRMQRDSGTEDDETTASSPPPVQRPRLLGTLRQQDLMLALLEIGGTTHRLQAGERLPDGQGQLLSIGETHIEITDAEGTRQTITLESAAPPVASAASAPSRRGPPRRGVQR